MYTKPDELLNLLAQVSLSLFLSFSLSLLSLSRFLTQYTKIQVLPVKCNKLRCVTGTRGTLEGWASGEQEGAQGHDCSPLSKFQHYFGEYNGEMTIDFLRRFGSYWSLHTPSTYNSLKLLSRVSKTTDLIS